MQLKFTITLLFVIVSKLIFAQTLDTTFGIGGKVWTNGPPAINGSEIALQPDGKIIGVGTQSGNSVAIRRFLGNGTIDSTFGVNGTVQIGGYEGVIVSAVAIQSDGKIVVGGMYGIGGTNGALLVRCTANGAPDNSFGTAGIVENDLSADEVEYIRSIAIQTDGKIVATGWSGAGITSSKIFLLRYLTNGFPDGTFGTGGSVITQFPTSTYDRAHAVAIQTNGRILVAGSAGIDSTSSVVVARYLTNGSLDNSFSGDGFVTTSIGAGSIANDIKIQSDGKIVITGFSNPNIILVRYSGNGSLDAGFGSAGVVSAQFWIYRCGRKKLICTKQWENSCSRPC